MRKFKSFLAAATLVLLTSCSGDSTFNSDIFCYFAYNTSIHNTGWLWAAVQPASYGQFVFVSAPVKAGVRYVVAQNSSGSTDEVPITTAAETRLNYSLGANNGLIIGRTTDGQLVAFDRQCPNCSREKNLYRYSLTFNAVGQTVHCSTCKRDYDLNNLGYSTSGGRKLDQYLVSYNGAMLIVHNKQ